MSKEKLNNRKRKLSEGVGHLVEYRRSSRLISKKALSNKQELDVDVIEIDPDEDEPQVVKEIYPRTRSIPKFRSVKQPVISRQLTVLEQIHIITECDRGLSIAECAAAYCIPPRVVREVIEDDEEICRQTQTGPDRCNRDADFRLTALNILMWRMYTDCIERNMNLSTRTFVSLVNSISLKIGLPELDVETWFLDFKQRHNMDEISFPGDVIPRDSNLSALTVNNANMSNTDDAEYSFDTNTSKSTTERLLQLVKDELNTESLNPHLEKHSDGISVNELCSAFGVSSSDSFTPEPKGSPADQISKKESLISGKKPESDDFTEKGAITAQNTSGLFAKENSIWQHAQPSCSARDPCCFRRNASNNDGGKDWVPVRAEDFMEDSEDVEEKSHNWEFPGYLTESSCEQQKTSLPANHNGEDLVSEFKTSSLPNRQKNNNTEVGSASQNRRESQAGNHLSQGVKDALSVINKYVKQNKRDLLPAWRFITEAILGTNQAYLEAECV